jgi:hypothetical protein
MIRLGVFLYRPVSLSNDALHDCFLASHSYVDIDLRSYSRKIVEEVFLTSEMCGWKEEGTCFGHKITGETLFT